MKFFRIATEGATTDGRVISRDWITQMAKSYDPKIFGARINLEHIRGTLPDGPFRAYGDVVALKAQDVEDGKLGLFAQIDPTPDLVAMAKARQKVYSSMEVDPNFAKTGQAYLVGLAVTDSPASLGVEMLAFASGASANPLAARKQSPENLISEAVEMDLDFAAGPEDKTVGLLTRIKDLLARSGDKAAATDARLTDAAQAVEALAEHQRGLVDRVTAAETAAQVSAAALTALQSAHQALAGQFGALQAAWDKDQDPHHRARPAATGGSGAQLTDC
jgi:hypothetical protein